MRKLALPDDILLAVEKPARYIGNEVNAVTKEPEAGQIRFALCFPDVYEIGMSHLGLQILYDLFNRRPDTWCERVFSPWSDLDHYMRERQIPLFALESQEPVQNFDFLGITIQYEMCYTNILQILDLARLPLRAAERGEADPIVIGGGPCVYNPEPIADFFDVFYIGEGEEQYDAILDLYKANKKLGGSREDYLRKLCKIPGMYVPKYYSVTYKDDQKVESFTPLLPEAPARVSRQVAVPVSELPYPAKPVVPFIKAVQDRVVLEIQRGCIRGCRFCQAGMIYRPTREKRLDTLKEQAKTLLQNTGHEEISLSSLSSSDYSQLPELVEYLITEFKDSGINISLPSLRIDAFALDVMSKVQDVRKSSLTFAPEAGTQRLRDVINKGLTETDILGGAAQAFAGGWTKVKLYFMLGLPTETETDMLEIPRLADKIARQYYEIPKEERQGKCQITSSTSFFIPKPFTPFQWEPMLGREAYEAKAAMLREAFDQQLNRKSLRYHWHDAATTIIEGALARGDRRLSAVIEAAYRRGALFDAWSDCFDLEKWLAAFADCRLALDFYTTRERDETEVLPWDFIDIGVTKQFLQRERARAGEARVTPNCRQECSYCGALKYQGGVCLESQNQVS